MSEIVIPNFNSNFKFGTYLVVLEYSFVAEPPYITLTLTLKSSTLICDTKRLWQ